MGGVRMDRPNSVPALVLGGGMNGLGVARSLGQSLVKVYLADTDVARPEMRTRYAHTVRLDALQGESLVGDLVALGEGHFRGMRPVLILTQEQTVRTIADAQDVLRPLFRFSMPSAQLLNKLMHKEGFYRSAESGDLRVPKTINIRSTEDIGAALQLSYPLIIKPALHSPAYGRKFRKAYRIDNADEAYELLVRILNVLPDVVVQEWIPGNDSDIYFCLQQVSEKGIAETSFVGRKIRSWPPNVGGTASCTSAPEHSALAEVTERYFAKVGMCGLASMEFKRHALTGEFFAIEPTVGRTDYQEEVATLNGVNLPYAYYRSLTTDGTAPAVEPVRDRRVVWRDRLADRRSSAHPEQVVLNWPRGHGEIRDALWRSSDPMPWLMTQWQRVAHRTGRLLNGFKSERQTR